MSPVRSLIRHSVELVGVMVVGMAVLGMPAAALVASRLQHKSAFIVIWTTTPWTIPANQALNAHPELTYALVDTSLGLLVLLIAVYGREINLRQ